MKLTEITGKELSLAKIAKQRADSKKLTVAKVINTVKSSTMPQADVDEVLDALEGMPRDKVLSAADLDQLVAISGVKELYDTFGDLFEAKTVSPKIVDMTDVDQEDAYDHTQTTDGIKDGDVLDLGDGNVAIMVQAWPTTVFGKIKHFHTLADDYSWDTIDNGKYKASHELAKKAAGKETK